MGKSRAVWGIPSLVFVLLVASPPVHSSLTGDADGVADEQVLAAAEPLGGFHSSSDDNTRSLLADDVVVTGHSLDVWMSGLLLIHTISLTTGEDAEAYLLRQLVPPLLMELVIEPEVVKVALEPASKITVKGRIMDNGKLKVSDMFIEAAPELSPGRTHGGIAASVVMRGNKATNQVDSWPLNGYDPNKVAGLPDEGAPLVTQVVPWLQSRTVTEMSVLVMVATICGMPIAAPISEIERVVFERPGSFAKTLQGYYWECSGQKTFLNETNSKVVGPIIIPCEADSSNNFTFTTTDCSFSDADGWNHYAQWYTQEVLGVDISVYKHRVLLMPRYFTYEAGCSWLGLGTLGPDQVNDDGSYAYSSVWISGEYWNNVMTYMHELGHTIYLHHSRAANECEYCDYSCAMGGCCDTRCFNPPHNWQLGWAKPLAQLNAELLVPG